MSMPASLECTDPGAAQDSPVEVVRPRAQLSPVVVASPHSGRAYDARFVADSRLDSIAIRRSEDSFIDEMFAAGPELGIPLIAARFPRVYCDVNREPYELDQQMFEERLPSFVNTRSVRVACGLGTIARVVSDGAEIYRRRLSFAEAERRIEACYRPYHRALKALVDDTCARFGHAFLLDCHSMPSVGGPLDQDAGIGRKDIVLGDRYGTTCDPRLIAMIEHELRGLGLDVVRNNPYAGGHTTQLYGRPSRRVHALQIEINRALYMDERTIERTAGFSEMQAKMSEILSIVGRRVMPLLAAC